MSSSVIQSDTGSLHRLQESLHGWGDDKSSKLMGDLLKKATAGEMTIAFCGHFSAGKSSLINSLCGKKVLPSSPVPTSANVVSIRNGQPHALIYPAAASESSGQIVKPQKVSLDELYTYCTNGGAYSSVEVWDHIPLLGGRGVLMDTPGVDSTDDSHQKATHSALHLADTVLYVMDYNHVQSENNLAFAKSLSDWGKPLYLVVNQIDKHRERELSFERYRTEVEAAFKRWQVNYESLLFTTLKEPEHPYNQWKQIQELIAQLIEKREPILNYSLDCSARHIVEQHVKEYADSLEDTKQQFLEEMGGEEQASKLEIEIAGYRKELERLKELPQSERESIRKQVDSLLDNANITPAELRETARLFLESRKSGFKVGLLFTGSKTEQEKHERLRKFVNELREQVASQVEWHLLELLKRWGKSLWTEERQQRFQASMPDLGEGMLESSVKPDAVVSGEYVLNYCRMLSADIKGLYRRAAMNAAEDMLADADTSAKQEQQRVIAALNALLEQSAAMSRYMQLERDIAERAAAAQQLLPARVTLTPGFLPAVSAPAPAAAQPPGGDAGARTAAPAGAPRSGAVPLGGAAFGRRQRLDAAAARLQDAAALLGRYPALASAARGLRSRAEALAGGSFTLALFGAFSAGKSSFANALLGERVLPVSPHPTTAAINRILAPQDGFVHGTAQVMMKSQDTFKEDLEYSFSVLQLGIPSKDGWLQAIQQLKPEGIHPAGLPHYGFLKAAAAGWAEAQPLLGTVQTVDMDSYKAFVADETRSCFVDRIDLYYSCPLTEQGIILVDTPGADSLHARHTGVTFQYMKHADAIVFVTYYNHAFSKGDRQFLTQLGRVKDSFALDKMFFIVNAADLASSEEELAQVVKHVETNLKARGIRLPHIYPVSSMNALEGKLEGDTQLYADSAFESFQKALGAFAGEELPKLSLAGAVQEISAVRQRVTEWGRLARQDAGSREERRQHLIEVNQSALARIDSFANQELSREVEQETRELLFHVKQRIGFSLGEFFTEAFHPSVLREDAGQLKRIFADCGRELERTIVHELEQELWATTLRLENKGKTVLHTAAQEAAHDIREYDAVIMLNPPEEQQWASPKWDDAGLTSFVDWSSFWSLFKSPKHFFEDGGREKLRNAVEPLIKEALSTEASRKQEVLASFYDRIVAEAQARQQEDLKEQLEEAMAAAIVSLDSGEQPEAWDQLSSQLQQMEQSLA
ncbi:dynamin family protein [Paenibacillus sp. KQZ6P-2]|uniref:Dynamin family protein n=1 Tax=Paenibacillus mangrovi TaxID=2931978 RepID=A0A9X1WV45_9BACL|nr:dynamin family protein [Paenibacillus mangrovi]MCJ8014300.1 dynamin family protein [Paenibacillus mangrovi]